MGIEIYIAAYERFSFFGNISKTMDFKEKMKRTKFVPVVISYQMDIFPGFFFFKF